MNDVGGLLNSDARFTTSMTHFGTRSPLRDFGDTSRNPSQHDVGDTSPEPGWLLLDVYEGPDGQTDGQTDEQTERQREGQTQPLTLLYTVG
ncbi:unnamed protein product [Heligmosomoides polygyrus]|uniref:ATP-binding protein n=1 Tax=Heligmosomoides polygyrus TaxID=6339 RepID=A0A183GMU1_HELPZ|nr:unnamed protein product [Heligmosomoides polygyrus]